MGANAQTSVPTFTAGEVLTAANMNISARTGVPVFATTTTRDAAFGGTGEKVLAEGQLAYIEASNIVQYYDGTNWQTLAPSLGGMTLLTAQSFSAVSSVNLPNDTFTSTYRNYRAIFELTAVSTNLQVTFRMRASGSDNTTSNYTVGYTRVGMSTGGTDAYGASGTSWASENATYSVSSTNTVFRWTADILCPQVAQYTTLNVMSQLTSTVPLTVSATGQYAFNATTQFDAMSMIASTGNFTGFYRVYGYADS